MPTTLHKLLTHAVKFGRRCKLPIGYYSEEAGEAIHQEMRKASSDHTRRDSYIYGMEYLYNHCMMATDPFIRESRKRSGRSPESLSPDVIAFLTP